MLEYGVKGMECLIYGLKVGWEIIVLLLIVKFRNNYRFDEILFLVRLMNVIQFSVDVIQFSVYMMLFECFFSV